MTERTRCDRTAAWSALCVARAGEASHIELRQAFDADAGRFEAFSQQAPHVFADLSKNLIDADIEHGLLQLARECGVEAHRDAMFAGAAINITLFSYDGTVHLGVNSDRAAVGDHELFARCLRASIDDAVSVGQSA